MLRLHLTVTFLSAFLGFSDLPEAARYPVPIPGRVPTIDLQLGQMDTRQHFLDQFPGFNVGNPKGEGCHGPTAVAGATTWIDQFCRNPAAAYWSWSPSGLPTLKC